MKQLNQYLNLFKNKLKVFGVDTHFTENQIKLKVGEKEISCFLADENFNSPESNYIPLDHLVTKPDKVVAQLLSQLKLNKTIFARVCDFKKINKKTAFDFLEQHHIMGATQSAYNYGLFHKNDLIALASFSKGRKMNRLKEHERSYEMIRFCCKSGITVTGGLSKLLKNFCVEKKAGDVMTYVDKQWSDGSSFIKAGFKKHSEKGANYFLVSKKTFERRLVKDKNCDYEKDKFYLAQSAGNIKLIYKP